MTKMIRFNAFSRIVNTMNLKIFPTHNEIYKLERKFNTYSGHMKGCSCQANLEGQGRYLHCLPFC